VAVLHRHAEPTALDVPGLAQLGDDRDYQLAWRREADADRTARWRDDGGADGDHLAVHVENGAARIARIDRRVELQEIIERSGAQVATTRRDDARGHGTTKTERIARRQHPV